MPNEQPNREVLDANLPLLPVIRTVEQMRRYRPPSQTIFRDARDCQRLVEGPEGVALKFDWELMSC